MANAVDGLTARSRAWVVPSPGATEVPVVPGTLPDHLALTNLSRHDERYVIDIVMRTGLQSLASGNLAPGASFSVGGPVIVRAGLDPILVRTTGTAAVSEDVGPTGTYGVVTMPGIPLSAATGS